MIKLVKICFYLVTFTLFASNEFVSPTEHFLANHPLSDIKYNLRLDNVTLIYKDLFDKIIPNESEGFIGYHGNSLEYRIYQDIIQIVLEEIVGVEVPKDFYFLDIPCFKEQKIDQLKDLPKFFSLGKNLSSQIAHQLFPINISLYANYNRIGFSSVVNFTSNTSTFKKECLKKDLQEFFQSLGMDPLLVEEGFDLGKKTLKNDRGILLQIYDRSEKPYSFVNKHCYPSYPTGYPFANRVISEFYCDELEYPIELKLLLTDQYTLNPKAPLTIKRYDKMQPSIVKQYETSLREMIKNATFALEKVKKYQELLICAWGE